MQNSIKRFVGIFLAALMLTGTVSVGAAYTPVTVEDVLEAAETADSLTLEWYGTMDGIIFDEAVDEDTVRGGGKGFTCFLQGFQRG